MSDDFDSQRRQMIDEQLVRRGITAPRVLEAMDRVPRERFVPDSLRAHSYADQALSIECGQTISQPYIVGLMTQALELAGNEHVLEIGTGSGYQAAVLAELAYSLVSVERHADLSQRAARILHDIGYLNVKLVVGDGTQGWPDNAPYDRIIVTAAAQVIPPALFDQLRDGGLLVAPLGDRDSQTLHAVRKLHGMAHYTPLSGCRFVPFVGAE